MGRGDGVLGRDVESGSWVLPDGQAVLACEEDKGAMTITSDALRKHWWALSENARSLFRILCENQDGVPKRELLATTDDGVS